MQLSDSLDPNKLRIIRMVSDFGSIFERSVLQQSLSHKRAKGGVS